MSARCSIRWCRAGTRRRSATPSPIQFCSAAVRPMSRRSCSPIRSPAISPPCACRCWPGLVRAALENRRRSRTACGCSNWARVFRQDAGGRLVEPPRLAGIAFGRAGRSSGALTRARRFLRHQGRPQRACSTSRGRSVPRGLRGRGPGAAFLPGRSAATSRVAGEVVGLAGETAPELTRELDFTSAPSCSS